MPLLRGSSVKLLPFRAPLKFFVSLVANQRESQYGNGPGAHEAARGGVFRAQCVGFVAALFRGHNQGRRPSSPSGSTSQDTYGDGR